MMATRIAACCVFALGLISAADAASWRPDKPVRLLIPFAPGGGADALSRAITPKLHESLGQPWVNDNRGGAGGNIAAEIVVRANPDGQTVFFGFSNVLTVNPLMYKLPFDPVRELIPVAMLNSGHYMLVLHPSVKADNFGEFIALAKSKAGALSYASSGIGTPLHLAAELFKVRTGTQLTHVPYKGGGPASIAVLAGEVQVLFGSLPSVLPHVKGGRLKALAVTGPKRAVLYGMLGCAGSGLLMGSAAGSANGAPGLVRGLSNFHDVEVQRLSQRQRLQAGRQGESVPARAIPKEATPQAGEFSARMTTRSPFPTPRAARSRAVFRTAPSRPL